MTGTWPCPGDLPLALRDNPEDGVPLIDPENGDPLRRDTVHSLVGEGGSRWPIVDGIPFLRTGRDALRKAALNALDAGNGRSARIALLADQDDYARRPPPGPAALDRLVASVDDGSASLRDAMAGLNFGAVADYFAHRPSTPTYLSGLALLDLHLPQGAAVVEVACGIGHFLRELASRGVPALGLDVVFAKLWLARRFIVPGGVRLICADAMAGWPLGRAPGPTVAFCHDAFYFLSDKSGVLASFRRTIGEQGRILIGHAHNSGFDHRGVAGEPLRPEAYAGLLPGCVLYDDAELAEWAWGDRPAVPREPAELSGVEAVALAWDASGRIAAAERPSPASPQLVIPAADRVLTLNPLLEEREALLTPRWPSPEFEAEYSAGSGYLLGEPMPRFPIPCRLDPGTEGREERERLARRRILLDLPERW